MAFNRWQRIAVSLTVFLLLASVGLGRCATDAPPPAATVTVSEALLDRPPPLPSATATSTVTLPAPPTIARPTATIVPATSTQAATAPPERPIDTPLVRYPIPNAVADGAVCNDGTPAGYYFRPSADPTETRWIVTLAGGGGCYDAASCGERNYGRGRLTSSQNWAETMSSDGILSLDPAVNPDFYNFNHAFIPYCSSDFWSGNAVKTLNGDRWHFKGLAILRGALSALGSAEQHGAANLRRATDVLFVGASAGGVGLHAQLDRLAAGMPWADVKGVNVSGWLVDVPVYSQQLPSSGARLAAYAALVNALPDEGCSEAYGEADWTCFWGVVGYPFIETPIYVYMNQRDSSHAKNSGVTEPIGADEQRYIDEAMMPAIVESLEGVGPLFSTTGREHGGVQGSAFVTLTIDGVALRTAIANWYFDRTADGRLFERP